MKRIILTAIFMAITISIHAQPNTVQVEYFLDVDSGVGLNTILNIASPDVDITETILADIPSNTSIGYHKLYIRAKDASDNWSQTIRKNIEIFAPVVENNIVMGEYFIDQDLEVGTANTFTINPEEGDIEQAFTAEILANTPLGYHKLYGRVKDSYGNWSHTFRKNIEVYENPVTNIVEIEYFFDDDSDLEFGNNAIVNIGAPEAEGTWSFNVPYPAGNYSFDDVLFVRVKDSNDNWSITTILDEIGILSTEEHLLKSTVIYPNPFQENIKIASTQNLSIEAITIYDTLGKMVYKSDTNSTHLNLGFLPQGMYFLKLSSNQGKASFKIIKK
ncbi:T9SS type A sorting domain-containing protein [Flaviramulus aquimarinus]